MSYTKEQYDMLEGFEYGILFSALSESEKQIFWFLDQQGLLLARSDIEDGLFLLSEKGKSVLTEHRMNLQKAEQEARQLAEKEAKEEKQQRFNNKIAIADLLISLISFFVGLTAEFHIGIYSRVVEWWPKMEAWFLGLFG